MYVTCVCQFKGFGSIPSLKKGGISQEIDVSKALFDPQRRTVSEKSPGLSMSLEYYYLLFNLFVFFFLLR